MAVNSPHSFFLSWHWIGSWLQCIEPTFTPQLLTVSADDQPVALAIFVGGTIWRHGIVPVRTWALNATGHPHFDCISTEYNGLLAVPEHRAHAWSKIMEYFATTSRDWDEIQLEGVSADMAAAWSSMGLPVREALRAPSRFVRLNEVRATPDASCISLLPSRVRTRLRHTKASLQSRLGPLTVDVASTRAEARNFIAELKVLHNAKWASHPSKGAFSRPFAERFHDVLVDRSFDEKVIQLVRIKAGSTTLGVLYNFVYQGRVLFYQSGVNYEASRKNESPGLLVHSLVIDHNATLGHEIYDLLAGDCQYKRTLAKYTNELWWGALQSQSLKLRIERLVVRQTRAFRGWLR
jgi:Acetyltransferase (GNAT) domain